VEAEDVGYKVVEVARIEEADVARTEEVEAGCKRGEGTVVVDHTLVGHIQEEVVEVEVVGMELRDQMAAVVPKGRLLDSLAQADLEARDQDQMGQGSHLGVGGIHFEWTSVWVENSLVVLEALEQPAKYPQEAWWSKG
jgi:hypothetical protein